MTTPSLLQAWSLSRVVVDTQGQSRSDLVKHGQSKEAAERLQCPRL